MKYLVLCCQRNPCSFLITGFEVARGKRGEIQHCTRRLLSRLQVPDVEQEYTIGFYEIIFTLRSV